MRKFNDVWNELSVKGKTLLIAGQALDVAILPYSFVLGIIANSKFNTNATICVNGLISEEAAEWIGKRSPSQAILNYAQFKCKK